MRLVGGPMILVMCVLAQPTAGAEHVSTPHDWTLSFTGLGPMRVGMTVREAEKALKMELKEEDASEPCHYATATALPDVGFMVEGGKIVRVDVHGGAYRTTGGVRIGMKEEEVKKLHPRIKSEPHPYHPSGHYLSLISKDGRYRIIFETDGKLVTNARGGERGPVGYIEGCQ